MFFSRKQATIKKVIKLTHKNSETLSITIEGSNVDQVEYISKRIKDTFNIPAKESKSFTQDMDEVWVQFHKLMDNIFTPKGK